MHCVVLSSGECIQNLKKQLHKYHRKYNDLYLRSLQFFLLKHIYFSKCKKKHLKGSERKENVKMYNVLPHRIILTS